MADAPETLSTLNGLVKEVYPDGTPPILVPDETRLQKMIPFVSKQKEVGNKYHQPVVLNLPSGFTQAGSGAGAFDLNDAAAGQMKDAQVQGAQILLRNQIDYEIAARSAGGRNAFMDVMPLVFETMSLAMRKRLEVEALYGSVGIGTIESYASGTPSITITAATFAAGIWALCEGMKITIYNGSTTTPRGSSANVATGSATVVAVDIENRIITLSGTVQDTAAGDTVYFYSGNTSAPEMAGLHKILTNTGSLFEIDAADYSGWRAPSYDAAGALNFEKVRKAVSRAVGRGLSEDVTLLVSTYTWDDLMTDLAALRRINEKGKGTYEIGADAIRFYSQNGAIEVVPSIYVKGGNAYGITPKKWVRGGAADISFKTPGMGEDIFLHLPTKAGYELRAYTNQFMLCTAPAKQFVITGIVNAS